MWSLRGARQWLELELLLLHPQACKLDRSTLCHGPCCGAQVNEYSLLFKWQGSIPELRPLL